jgi:hypothetical protein
LALALIVEPIGPIAKNAIDAYFGHVLNVSHKLTIPCEALEIKTLKERN